MVLVHGFSGSKAFYDLSGSGGSVKNVFGDNINVAVSYNKE